MTTNEATERATAVFEARQARHPQWAYCLPHMTVTRSIRQNQETFVAECPCVKPGRQARTDIEWAEITETRQNRGDAAMADAVRAAISNPFREDTT